MTWLAYDGRGLERSWIGEGRGIDGSARREAWRDRLGAARQAVLDAHEAGTLGFLTCFEQDHQELESWCEQVRTGARFTHQLVLGIGGSSLGALAILATQGGQAGGLETHFSENIDPRSFARLLERLPLERTLIIIISKSGTTIETMSKFWIVYDRLIARVGEEKASEHIVAITDPEKGSLRKLAKERGFKTFGVPPEVGGRFSVLTPVGLVPLCLAGYDIDALCAGARQMRRMIETSDVDEDMTLQAAADQLALLEQGITQVVVMPYCDDLLPLADWFRQLWAESIGKRTDRRGKEVFTGITPIKALGVIDQHSQVQLYMEGPADKHVMFLEVLGTDVDFEVPAREGFPEALSHLQGKTLSSLLAAELEGTARALADAGRPTSRWQFDDITPRHVGAFILAWEMITAVTGELLDINAFDQPGVELGKKIAHGLLGHEHHSKMLADFDPPEQVGAIEALRVELE